MTTESEETVTSSSVATTAVLPTTLATHDRLKSTRDASQAPMPTVDTRAAQYGPYQLDGACADTNHSGPNSNSTWATIAVSAASTTTRRSASVLVNTRSVVSACRRYGTRSVARCSFGSRQR